ncbi:coiled-coil domain-containing protein 97 [Hyalella azteca]|uniref:Coiled-coil domain-containing protein 97 n=1 Tax=Hyalella azteca TaxID=294128 RepID=A0A8B7NDW2_HYAAZ|nr:coiled-coil domain-containing protein 97 [Hyalella azteca]
MRDLSPLKISEIMFGELEDADPYPPPPAPNSPTPALSSHTSTTSSGHAPNSTFLAPNPSILAPNSSTNELLSHRIARHLALKTDVVLKSQQRGEPELSTEEKIAIALQMMMESPSQFLYRFGRHLLLEHLELFEESAVQDSLVAHYLAETRAKLDNTKHKTVVRNRRWAAVQRLKDASLSTTSSSSRTNQSNNLTEFNHEDYFSESEMKKRNPLLYQQLVGQHLTEDERQAQKQNFDRSDCRFTTIIYDHLDQCFEKELQKEQEEREDDMFEEEEESEEEDEEAMDDDAEATSLHPDHKTLLREEFMSSMYHSFISGKDESFNYKAVDENEDLDLLEVEARDKEEEYFDDEQPCAATPMCSAPESPVLPRHFRERVEQKQSANIVKVCTDNSLMPSSEMNHVLTNVFPHVQNHDENLPHVESLTLN